MSDEVDGIAALEAEFKRQEQESRCLPRLSKARAKLVLGREPKSAFFATLAMKKKIELDWREETGSIDGKTIRANPAWIDSLSDAQVEGFLAHEVLHVANKHHTRIPDGDLATCNLAGDLAINPLLAEAGFTLPPGALFPEQGPFRDIPKGLSYEEIYHRLRRQAPPAPKSQPGDQGGDGGPGGGEPPDDEEAPEQPRPPEGEGDRPQEEGQPTQPPPQPPPQQQEQPEPEPEPTPDPGRSGGFSRPGKGTRADVQQAEAEADAETAQAYQAAKRRGALPAGLERSVGEALYPKPDCWDVLQEFVMLKVKQHMTWNVPNRRHVWQDVYLPSKGGETLGRIVLAFDMSGSIGEKEAQTFWGGIRQIIDRFPCKLTILYHDTEVAGEQEWDPAEGDELELEPKGGGGTSHVDVFRRVGELCEEHDDVSCVICLTDLYTEFPAEAPAVPVLWAVLGGPENTPPPFGERVDMELAGDA